jgi:hypothetical protein
MKMSHQNEELKGRRSLCNEHISAHGKTTANTAHVEIKRNLSRMIWHGHKERKISC